MANIPSITLFPAGLPTQDPVLAGFLTQLSQSITQWSIQITNLVNILDAQNTALRAALVRQGLSLT